MARYSKYSSRKLWYSVATSLLVFAAGLVSAYVVAFRSGLEIVIGGLLGTLGIYTGSSVGSRYLSGKTGIPEEVETPEPDPAPKKTKPKE